MILSRARTRVAATNNSKGAYILVDDDELDAVAI